MQPYTFLLRVVVSMRRIAGIILMLTLFVVAVGPFAQAQHSWNCRDISLKLSGKLKINRTVCYPCPIDLPEGTPYTVVLLWEQEICAPAE